MITIQIDEKQMKEMLSQNFKETIKTVLEDSNLEYWVRDQVHKLFAKEVFDKEIKPILNKENITEMLQTAFDNYVYAKFGND